MSAQTASRVLAKIAAYEPTFPKPDPIILAAWAEALEGCPQEAALAAVTEHYRTTSQRIMPADILRIVKSHPRVVTASTANMVPNADPDDVPAYLEALRRGDLVDNSPRVGAPARPIAQLIASTLAKRKPVESEAS
jgi:hypothetical protein